MSHGGIHRSRTQASSQNEQYGLVFAQSEVRTRGRDIVRGFDRGGSQAVDDAFAQGIARLDNLLGRKPLFESWKSGAHLLYTFGQQSVGDAREPILLLDERRNARFGAGVGLAYNVIIAQILGIWFVVPEVDPSLLTPVLMGMLGMGAMRSYEKTKGVQREK